MKLYEGKIISKISENLIKSLWEVIFDKLQFQDREVQLNGAKIFLQLLNASTCIDKDQIATSETHLKEVCTAFGAAKDQYKNSSIYEIISNIRRIFLADDTYLSHYATSNGIKGLNFSTPSQQALFDAIHPKFKVIISDIDKMIKSHDKNIRENGIATIQNVFKS